MQNIIPISKDFFYVGSSDHGCTLFESHIPISRGVSYNSYLLKDESVVLFDLVDTAVADAFLENLEAALGGRKLDYLVLHHMEPDHTATFLRFRKLYPATRIVTNQKVVSMLKNFFPFTEENVFLVKEGDTMSVGRRTLRFIFAPMVHWPEVMMTYIEEEKTLLSADAFGTFGALGGSIFADEVHFEEEFLPDARKYYFNIVGKYGIQVQNVLKKAAALDIARICPLHGPIWRSGLEWYLKKYDTWSKYEPEEKGVAIFCASIYGHTENAARILAADLAERGVFVKVYDVTHTHVCDLLAEAFRYSHAVFASATHNLGIFLPMEVLLIDLKAHFWQKRGYALIENGSWSPQAGALMEEVLGGMRDLEKLGETVTVLSAVKEGTCRELHVLADAIAKDYFAN